MTAEKRREVTEAFRLYARKKAEGKTVEIFGSDEWLTVSAVSKTLSYFRAMGKPHIAEAVEWVYFADPFEPLRKGDIDGRITRYCTEKYAFSKSVYRWLKDARLIYWAIRYP